MLPYPLIRSEQKAKPSERSQDKKQPGENLEKFIQLPNQTKDQAIAEGKKEAVKELAKQEALKVPRVAKIKQQSRELYRIHSVFPFDLFRDSLIVEETKVTFIWNQFFYSGEIKSILVKDIADIMVESGLWFAKLKIMLRMSSEKETFMEWLKKDEALRARTILQGLLICYDQKTDLSTMSVEETVAYALQLGGATQ